MRDRLLLVLIVAAAMVISTVAVKADVPTLIGYQGVITDSEGEPITGVHNVTFTIYDAPTVGNDVWTETQTVTFDDEGRFDVLLGEIGDITDDVFDDPVRWLGVQVEGDAELEPRTRIVSVAYAHRISTVDGAGGGTISGDVAIQSDLDVDGDIRVTGKATIGPGHNNTGLNAFVAGETNSAWGDHSTVGGGIGNTAGGLQSVVGGGYGNEAGGEKTVIGGGEFNTVGGNWGTTGGGRFNFSLSLYGGISSGYSNQAGDQYADTAAYIGGGYDNSAMEKYSTVSGGYDNTASADYATVGGGAYNKARGNYSVVSGGGGDTEADSNSAIGDYSVIGGGRANVASTAYNTVCGGYNNSVQSDYGIVCGGQNNTVFNEGWSAICGGKDNIIERRYSFIGGGTDNHTRWEWSVIGGGWGNLTNGARCTIAGGEGNVAGEGTWATVGGGWDNTASGQCAVIPGGCHNLISGDYSMAAGSGARAIHNGAFVWADAAIDELESTADNQIMMLGSGGTWIYSDPDLLSGVTIHPGASAWATYSDRSLKENLTPVDSKEILQKISSLPINEWNFRAQSDNVKHIGPTAQDFYSVFGLGDDDKTISTIDPSGVAIAGIQGLLDKIEQLEARIAELEAERR